MSAFFKDFKKSSFKIHLEIERLIFQKDIQYAQVDNLTVHVLPSNL